MLQLRNSFKTPKFMPAAVHSYLMLHLQLAFIMCFTQEDNYPPVFLKYGPIHPGSAILDTAT